MAQISLERSTRLRPDDVVLVLMDLQNDIVRPDGAFPPAVAETERVNAAVEHAASLLTWARDARVPVAHVAVGYRPGHPEIDRALPLFRAVAAANALVEGSWGAGFDARVAPAPGEWVIVKRGIDALAGNDLPLLCTQASRRVILLAGVQTDAVVLGTALTAVDHGLRPVIVEDACAGSSFAAHQQALRIAAATATMISAHDLTAAP